MLLFQLSTREKDFSTSQVNWIHTFIETSPQSMQLLGDSIKNIVKDGKIDLHDIPIILRMITEITHDQSLQKEMFNKTHLLLFARFTLDSLLESKFLLLPGIEKEIIEKMINGSLDLLQYNIVDIRLEEDCCENLFAFWKGK